MVETPSTDCVVGDAPVRPAPLVIWLESGRDVPTKDEADAHAGYTAQLEKYAAFMRKHCTRRASTPHP